MSECVTHKIDSPHQAHSTIVRMLLPEEPVPVKNTLFVLPVEPDLQHEYGDGLHEVQQLDLHNTHGLLVVAPTFSHAPWYVDHPTDPTIRQETYFLQAVVPLVDRLVPDSGKRLLVGFSKSGFGALAMILRHPDLFHAASVWDAATLLTCGIPHYMRDIIGDEANYERYRLDKLFIKAGDDFRAQMRIALHGYGEWREDMVAAHELLADFGIAHEYLDGPERPHRWDSGWVAGAVASLVRMAEQT